MYNIALHDIKEIENKQRSNYPLPKSKQISLSRKHVLLEANTTNNKKLLKKKQRFLKILSTEFMLRKSNTNVKPQCYDFSYIQLNFKIRLFPENFLSKKKSILKFSNKATKTTAIHIFLLSVLFTLPEQENILAIHSCFSLTP